MNYLNKLDVTQMLRQSQGAKKRAALAGSRSQPEIHNVRYRPGEVHRQIDKAIDSLQLQKMANISNYTGIDNQALQRQYNLLRSCVVLPHIRVKRSTSHHH